MSSLTLEFDEKQLKRILDAARKLSPGESPKVFQSAFHAGSQIILKRLSDNVSNKILKRRSGKLAQSLGYRVDDDGGAISATIGSGVLTGKRVKYADIQERGGEVRGKPWLTVPLPAALTPAGVMKMPRARDFPNTFIQKSKKGNLLIFQKKDKGIRPLFVLKRSVTIKPSRYMAESLRQTRGEAIKKIEAVIMESVSR